MRTTTKTKDKKSDPISDFEDKMLKVKILYRKHIKNMKKEKARRSQLLNAQNQNKPFNF